MKFLRSTISNDSNIGLYGFATDKYCLLGQRDKKVEKVLKVPLRVNKFFNTSLAGIFCVGNSSGIIVPDIIEEDEITSLEKHFKVLVLKTTCTAIGNMIVMNDKGIIISPLLKKERKKISEFFDLPCEITTIAGSKVIGSSCIATNNGCLSHPKTKEREEKVIEKTLGVKVDIGTINFGSPFVKAGILANSNGFVVSKNTSGHEMGRASEALGFV